MIHSDDPGGKGPERRSELRLKNSATRVLGHLARQDGAHKIPGERLKSFAVGKARLTDLREGGLRKAFSARPLAGEGRMPRLGAFAAALDSRPNREAGAGVEGADLTGGGLPRMPDER